MEDDDFSKPAKRTLVVRAMSLAQLKTLPADWATALVRCLSLHDVNRITEAIAVLHATPPRTSDAARVSDALRSVAGDDRLPPRTRLEALAAIAGGPGELDEKSFNFLRTQLAPDAPLLSRTGALRLLYAAKLTVAQQLAAADFLSPRVTSAVDRAQQMAHLDELASSLKNGDIRRGQAVFNSPKAGCAGCHAMGYLGGNLGPDLTRIGQIRSERDLLEAIVYPSSSFVRSYEPTLLTTRAGDIYNGIVRGESAEMLTVAIAAGSEVRVAHGDLTSVEPGEVSLMPQGFDRILSAQELSDLIAFLKAAR